MIQHGFVVDDFLKGMITPIVKDSQGDLTSISNFCRIKITKMFELAIDYKISHLLGSDSQKRKKKIVSTFEHYLINKIVMPRQQLFCFFLVSLFTPFYQFFIAN